MTLPVDRPSELELGRRAFRRRQTVRSVLVAAGSTAVVAGVLWWLLATSEGWPVVAATFFDPEEGWAALPRVWAGFLVNLRVLAVGAVLVAVLSVLLAALRTLRGPVFFPIRFLVTAYTSLFRGLPFIIVLYLVGFGIPALQLTDTYVDYAVWGTIALVLTYTAYVTEVLRAGIEAVHPSQLLAARGLGLSHSQTMRTVVYPQAVRKVTPPLMNDFISMQKDVGLISVLGAVDAIRAAQIETATSFNYTPYVVAGLLFVLLALPMIWLTDWYTARLRRREQAGAVL